MSAYAPQSGETEKIKEAYLKDWEDLVSRVPRSEKVVVGADLNGHVGKNPGVFQRVHGGKGYGQRNGEGENARLQGNTMRGDYITAGLRSGLLREKK